MDTIEIEQWSTVSKWQRIWTVWNSGNTFWALGWYHVHFEVAKDVSWRPRYSYLDCPDVSKWDFEIIKKWLCREQLFANEYDPIKLIEWNYSMPILVDNNKAPETINNVVPASDNVPSQSTVTTSATPISCLLYTSPSPRD